MADSTVLDSLQALLPTLDRELEDAVPVVRLRLEDGRQLDVFRADRVRERPIAWRIRGFVGDIRPTEFVAVLLGALDGRAVLTMAADPTQPDASAGGQVVQVAVANRRMADLVDLVAARVRARFGPPTAS
ncbi:MAG: hypothetical protein IPH07_11455 [Deltaproteobacteria bacterium]|nr:hypothetical protein [Deltaproteobacteria bacterium]MBK8720374.1 hypothetical protein [Deltaproteobacteria bacterium]MBP7285485.1 hypothetical protein [Nannocystaceae bacterium]